MQSTDDEASHHHHELSVVVVRQLLQDQQNDEDDLVGVNSLNCDAISSVYKDSGKKIIFMASRKKIYFSLRFAKIFIKYFSNVSV